jgi:hypothetical protein
MKVKQKTVCPSFLELDGKAKKYAPRNLYMTVKQKAVCPSTLAHHGKATNSMPLDP